MDNFQRRIIEINRLDEIFNNEEFSELFLKTYIHIHEKFVLSDNKDGDLLKLYVINKMFNQNIECEKIREKAIKYKLIKLLSKHFLTNEEFSIKKMDNKEKSFKFGRISFKLHDLFYFFIECSTQLLRRCPESHNQLRETNLSNEFFQRVNLLTPLAENLEGNKHFLEMLLYYYEIATYFYNGKNGQKLKLTDKIIAKYILSVLDMLMISFKLDNYLLDSILILFNRAVKIPENVDLILEQREKFILICSIQLQRCQRYVLQMFLSLLETNSFDRLPEKDPFFENAFNTLMKMAYPELKMIAKPLLKNFIKRFR